MYVVTYYCSFRNFSLLTTMCLCSTTRILFFYYSCVSYIQIQLFSTFHFYNFISSEFLFYSFSLSQQFTENETEKKCAHIEFFI